MIIEKILKEINPQRIKKEIKEIQDIELPKELQKWVDEYQKVGERDEFVWKWLYKMWQIIKLPITFKKCEKNLLEIKILVTMFDILLDDVADITKQKQNKNLLSELLKISSNKKCPKINHLNSTNKKYLIFTYRLWTYIQKQIKKYPNYKKLNELFEFDISQMLNTMVYSYLVNKNIYLINKEEYWLYFPNNMAIMPCAMLDLMCCKKFHLKKIGIFREIICEAQKMARISNWATTWEREIRDNDFTSGVFAYAIKKGIVSYNQLKTLSSKKIVEKIKSANIESKLLKEWENYYKKIEYTRKNIDSKIITNILNVQKQILLVDMLCQNNK